MKPLGRKQYPLPESAHWGKMLQRALRVKKWSASELARNTRRSAGQITRYFPRDNSETGTLWELGKALNHNFFLEIAQAFDPEYFQKQQAELDKLTQTLQTQEAEIQALKLKLAIAEGVNAGLRGA